MIAGLAEIQADATGTDGELVALELQLCHQLGCLEVDAGGFVAWLRCREQDIPLLHSGDIGAVRKLPRSVLLGGPVMFIVDILAVEPGYGFRKVRELCRKPGVEMLHGLTAGRWRTRRCRG